MNHLRLVTALALATCGCKNDAAPTAGAATRTAGAPAAAAGTPATAAGAAAAAAPAGTPVGKCTFHVTGDLTLAVEAIATRSPSNPKASATTDYWQTEDQLRTALKVLGGLDSKKSKEAIAAEVDAAMKKDPRFMLLLINCGAELGSLNFTPSNHSKYADLLFKPGTYPIASDAKQGEFGLIMNLRPPGPRKSFRLAEPGTLELTKFDLTGIAGTFTFKAKSRDDKQAVEITGSFDYPCVGGACKPS